MEGENEARFRMTNNKMPFLFARSYAIKCRVERVTQISDISFRDLLGFNANLIFEICVTLPT